MYMLWSAFISLVQLGVYVKCFSNETGYEIPAGWHGNVNSDELRRVITDENVTIPGFDPMMMNKFRGFMGQVQTLNDDNDATVDRYNTPTYSINLATDKILQEKYMAITDYVEPAAYKTHFMVNDLIGKGYVKSVRVVEAMREVDKEEFAPMDPLDKGHYDYPIDLGYGTWMEPPYQIAGSLEYMKRHLTPGSKVLEIGAGTGYMTSLLSLLAGHVTAIEHVPELANRIKDNMVRGAPRVYFRKNFDIICADGRKGYRPNGPYDVIYISASFPDVPFEILEQIKPGGVLVLSINQTNGKQKLTADSTPSLNS
ncbi:hypothetical protein M8J77_020924 [Diaphorina citri]|nr:hypothetical protein M8J77_020924 [Diaphorina citri]